MKKLILLILLILLTSAPLRADEVQRQTAVNAMVKATRYFRTHVATNGGYLWRYKTDFSLREGEGTASATTIWVQPPGTPSVGMALLAAYEATRDTLFLNGAVDAAHALAWGQLASGGWDYRIEFDAGQSNRWHYRRDLERGDVQTDDRRNRTTLDDNTTQSALQLLMRVDKTLGFEDAKIHRVVQFGLDALLKAQYPNGAWPQRFEAFPDPEKFPIKKARYPKTWPRTHPDTRYVDYYTFNDNAIADVIETMIEAHAIYGDARYLDAAIRGGDFMLLAQMPAPQPAWAQQYNLDMEPTWARRFEPPAITGGESFGVMQTLLDLYIQTGEQRFLDPIPPALDWAKRSRLADGRIARFYELQTNRPLYFTRDYALTYSDADLPRITHSRWVAAGSSGPRTCTSASKQKAGKRCWQNAGASRCQVSNKYDKSSPHSTTKTAGWNAAPCEIHTIGGNASPQKFSRAARSTAISKCWRAMSKDEQTNRRICVFELGRVDISFF